MTTTNKEADTKSTGGTRHHLATIKAKSGGAVHTATPVTVEMIRHGQDKMREGGHRHENRQEGVNHPAYLDRWARPRGASCSRRKRTKPVGEPAAYKPALRELSMDEPPVHRRALVMVA